MELVISYSRVPSHQSANAADKVKLQKFPFNWHVNPSLWQYCIIVRAQKRHQPIMNLALNFSIPFNASVHLFLYVLVSSFLDLMCFHYISHLSEDTKRLKRNIKIGSSPMSIRYQKFICRILCILSLCWLRSVPVRPMGLTLKWLFPRLQPYQTTYYMKLCISFL